MQDKKLCNCCGRELDIWDIQEAFIIHRDVGYGSIFDGHRVHLQFCCDCFDNIVQNCKVSPIEEVIGW